MYPEYLVAPMRQELVNAGFQDLRTADEVEQAIKSEGTVLVMVNSVHGCEGRSFK
jgi:putative YphP/YqiW family bacilliredoxin